MVSNPYAQALHDNIDYHFCKDPMNNGQPTELPWSLLSMKVIYTTHTTNTSPYLPMHSKRLYDCLDFSEINSPRVLNGDCSDRFEEVQSTLKISTHFWETGDVSTTYMSKLFPTGRKFEFENQIFVSGNCTSHGALMNEEYDPHESVLGHRCQQKLHDQVFLHGQHQSLYNPKIS